MKQHRLRKPVGPAVTSVARRMAALPRVKPVGMQGRCAPPLAMASRSGEAILDRGHPPCLVVFRPGRENGAPAEPENWIGVGEGADN